MIGMPAYSMLVISTRTQCHLISAWATVPHIHHFFLHQSLSDSNLPFDSPLNAQISAPFQETLPEPRAKIAGGRV
jgi:hypothetical protein